MYEKYEKYENRGGSMKNKKTQKHLYFRFEKKTLTAGIIMSVALGIVAAGILKMKHDAEKKSQEKQRRYGCE